MAEARMYVVGSHYQPVHGSPVMMRTPTAPLEKTQATISATN